MSLQNSDTQVTNIAVGSDTSAHREIRATLLSNAQLREKAEAFARNGAAELPEFEPFDFFDRHRENEKEILRVYRAAAADVDAGKTITPAAEWLLDNHYVVEEAIQEVRRDFPKKFYQQLRTMTFRGAAMPRTLALSWLYVAYTHSNVTNSGMAALAEGFQEKETLRIGELWALPSLVRYTLIDNLRRVAIGIEKSRELRRRAETAAEAALRLKSEAETSAYLTALEPDILETTFATQFLYRLREDPEDSAMAVAWLENRLAALGTDSQALMAAEQSSLAAGNIIMGSIIKSLREIDDTDWSSWVEEVSKIDKLLWTKTDYAELDPGSRNSYRRQIEKLARRSDKSEVDIAEAAIRLADAAKPGEASANVGSLFVGADRAKLEAAIGYRPHLGVRLVRQIHKLNWAAIAIPVLALTALALVVVGAFLLQAGIAIVPTILLLVLFALPASEGATGLFNFVVTFFMTPDRLVGYEFKKGVPADARTLVTIPCLISNRDNVDELVRNLEVHYLANPLGEVYFALLSDWPDSQVEESENDLEVLDYARREIANLSARYAGDGVNRFFLLHRRRLYNPQEGAWMGWERKRGKLHELNLLLRGDRETTFIQGAAAVPKDVQYVMTLDSDTRLMRETVTKLVGKLYHPLNRPVFDATQGRVVSGYGVLQPRVTPSLTTGRDASVFQRVFSVNRGLDPYVFTVSDVYQDIVGEGTFTGKGLYHIDAFEASLVGKIKENAVLSHDLLEGSMARCALVTDCELVEDFPIRYEVEVSRQHRWARGDWQLLPYIFDSRYGITGLGRWKMLDNLRRSLTPIAWFIASALGWYVMSPLGALLWQILLIFCLFVAPTLSLINGIIPRTRDIVARAHLYTVLTDIRDANAQVALRIAFIADNACNMADAIGRSLYRLLVSKKLMLQWRTAASAQAMAQTTIIGHYRVMWQSPVLALLAIVLAMLSGDYAFLVGIPFVILWVLSPAIAWSVSQTAETEDTLAISDHVKSELRKIARRTWRYFETFVVEAQHFLPPDNVQQTPHAIVAPRTSPTNIGVYMLSIISARHFGWITFEETITRLEQTVATVDKLEKYRGHLLNWYHTDTLKPLGQRYVSAVDSGNFAGHLVAVSAACRLWAEAPTAHIQGNIDGMGDVAGILVEILKALPDDRKGLRPLRQGLEQRISGFLRALNAVKREQEFASVRIVNLFDLARDIQQLAVSLDQEVKSNRSGEVVRWAESLVKVCDGHVADSIFDLSNADALRRRLVNLRNRTRAIAFAMDFSFLYRPERRLLSIGFRVETGELDAACYDLLASEARLTSLFAIAKGDLPTEHWYRLGRHVVPVGSRGALVSWSGSMFEYLMPPLVMQERQGGILNQTNNLIVTAQIDYARGLGIPWGISEAAFNARDHQMKYQYSNFGVPTLGLKRGLGQNTVIAPYASLLASQYQPAAALENLNRLRALGALGMYGFHDAVDFTPARVPEGKKCAVVYNYYAHHHGMSIAAIANVAFNGRLRELFHADPVIEAAELLLQEKAPRDIPYMAAKHETAITATIQGDLLRPEVRRIDDPASKERELVLLSNGHYSMMLTATGSGYARWNGLSVTRWQPDPTEDRWGSYIFLRDTTSNEWWSTTSEPRSVANEIVRVSFSDDKAEFVKIVGDLTSEVEVLVASGHDAEGRRLTLTNAGKEDRSIEVTSYLEPVITIDGVDTGHPVYARMFVKTEAGKRSDVLYAERNKRDDNEPDMVVAHLFVDGSDGAGLSEFETDRRRFIGRGRGLTDAAAFDPGSQLSGTDGFTMDACLSLRRIVRVPAGGKVSVLFWTIAAPSRDEADRAIERYRQPDAFTQELPQAWTRTQTQLRRAGVNSRETAVFQGLARYLIYPDMHLRADIDTVTAGLQSQAALWVVSISGDAPIFTLRVTEDLDTEIVREALKAQAYLHSRAIYADLVILNERPDAGAEDLQHAIEKLCDVARNATHGDGMPQNIYVLRKDLIELVTYDAILAASRAVFDARDGGLIEQIKRAPTRFASALPTGQWGDTTLIPRMPTPVAIADTTGANDDLEFWNGYGGFADDGREYVVRLSGGQSTPQPWINVVANEHFGFHIAAEGAAFTWSGNSRDYQLTAWTNDMVVNRPGEAFYVADLESGAVMTPYAGLSHRLDARFETRHGLGYSVFTSTQDELALTLTHTVHREKPIKLMRIRIHNTGERSRTLRLYGYAEWILGANPSKTKPFVIPSYDGDIGAVFAANPFSIDYAGRVAVFAANEKPLGGSVSRREFVGRYGTIQQPKAVFSASPLSGAVELDGDPAAALSFDLTLAAGEQKDICFYMADTVSNDAARALLDEMRGIDFETVLTDTRDYWSTFTGRLQIETPDAALNHMVNHWLPYQTLGCNVIARTAFYQASGAVSFRDQLQDTLAFLVHSPELARKQILDAGQRQFREGDVQHWWLTQNGAGVRTHIADDVVWLAYAVDQYCSTTGDRTILDEELHFVEGATLTPGMHDAFYKPEISTGSASLYEHAALALDLAVKRTGSNGLPLILSGDWTEGLNRVGVEGRGESVWLGWFLAFMLRRFIGHAEERADAARALRWAAHLKDLKAAIETAGWDGEYYLRGYFDDGAPLGSRDALECQIDSTAQTWNILSGEGDPERGRQAIDTMLDRLVDDNDKSVRLFTPPFTTATRDPGLIRAYPPGVRENGGQYTQGAAWSVMALARMGRGDDAWRLFGMLNPVGRALSREDADLYRVEPYVAAADVYSEGALKGRGGWTWYTNSAGWLYRTAVEEILGIKIGEGGLQVKPALPSSWNSYTVNLSLPTGTYRVAVSREEGSEGYTISVNGQVLGADERVALSA